MDFNVKSIGNLNEIAFHDCWISQAEWQDTKLILHFEWLDILKTHPQNTTGFAKMTDAAIIIFNNPVIFNCKRFNYTKAFEEGKRTGKRNYTIEDAEVIYCELIQLCQERLEISCVEIRENDETYIFKCYCQQEEFDFSFDSAVVCWNNFIGNTWFEGWPDN